MHPECVGTNLAWALRRMKPAKEVFPERGNLMAVIKRTMDSPNRNVWWCLLNCSQAVITAIRNLQHCKTSSRLVFKRTCLWLVLLERADKQFKPVSVWCLFNLSLFLSLNLDYSLSWLFMKVRCFLRNTLRCSLHNTCLQLQHATLLFMNIFSVPISNDY